MFYLQVEFAPTFEEQPMYEQWSWDQNPVNLTCIATGIPNATITWWVRDREINREVIDRNMQVNFKEHNYPYKVFTSKMDLTS